MTKAYDCGAADAHYEERRGSGYTPSRYAHLGDQADYIAGYLSVNSAHQPAQADKRNLAKQAQPVSDPKLVYESDGNVLFYPEPARRRR